LKLSTFFRRFTSSPDSLNFFSGILSCLVLLRRSPALCSGYPIGTSELFVPSDEGSSPCIFCFFFPCSFLPFHASSGLLFFPGCERRWITSASPSFSPWFAFFLFMFFLRSPLFFVPSVPPPPSSFFLPSFSISRLYSENASRLSSLCPFDLIPPLDILSSAPLS